MIFYSQRFRPVAPASDGPSGSAFFSNIERWRALMKEEPQMAFADYYLCDVCEAKCFYDANLNWEQSTKQVPIPEDQWVRSHPGLKLDRCGDMKAICRDCAKTHVCQVVEK